MNYILDTDTIIFLMKFIKGVSQKDSQEKGNRIQNRLKSAIDKKAEIAIATITEAELLYGAVHSQNYDREIIVIENVLQPFKKIDFSSKCALSYAFIRKILRKSGCLIRANDLIIASIASAWGATIVTNNTKEFKRIPGIYVENWTTENISKQDDS